MLDVRPSPIAGKWYERDAQILSRSVDEYLNEAHLPELEGEVVAVIAPHAGHRYSGSVAGYAFAALRSSSPELVAVIAPMHHPYVEPLITTAHDAYATPLGEIPVDKDARHELDRLLRSELGFGLTPVQHDPEHSLEIELPFLQRALTSQWKLLPVMVRALEPRVSETLGKALAGVLRGKNAVMVGSTDLSHFYSQQTAQAYDHAMLDEIEAFDPKGMFDLERGWQRFRLWTRRSDCRAVGRPRTRRGQSEGFTSRHFRGCNRGLFFCGRLWCGRDFEE